MTRALSILTTGLCLTAGLAACSHQDQNQNLDTVTVTASSCESGCSAAPTITASSEDCQQEINCDNNCTVTAGSNRVNFSFQNANGVTFTTGDQCQAAIPANPVGASYDFSFSWKSVDRSWYCHDPIITVTTGVCDTTPD